MAWVKLDDHFTENPKVMGLSSDELRAYIEFLCYSARNLTDGRLTLSMAVKLGWGDESIALMDAGLLDSAGIDEYQIHDYLDYNPSKEQVLTERARTAERVRRHRNPVTNAGSNTTPLPDPSPDPESPSRSRTKKQIVPLDDEYRSVLHERYGAYAPRDRVEDEIELALSHDSSKKYTNLKLYVNKWLRREFIDNTRSNGNGRRPAIAHSTGEARDHGIYDRVVKRD